MEEIVVSGSRVRESLLRTPAAVSVVDRSRYANGRAIGLDDLLAGVPGVLVQSRGGSQDVRITIRGYGARGNGERSNSGSMRGIRVLSDGVPITEPDGRTSLDLVDVGTADRVEIARSNLSALYGNASGGVVNLITDFGFDRNRLKLDESGGSFGLRRDQVSYGFVAGRGRGVVTGSNTNYDGWRKHSGSTSAEAHLRLSAPLGESGNDRLTFLGDFANNLIRFPGPLTEAEYAANPEAAAPRYVTRDERRFNRIGRLAGTLDHSFSDRQSLSLMLFAEPKALQRSERNRYRDFTRFHVGGQAVWSLEVPMREGLVSRTSAGVDEALQDGSILFWNLNPDGTRSTTIFANKREGANSAGAFVQQAFTWNERWTAQAALRYDDLWYTSQDFLNPTLDDQKHFTRVTPKLSVGWTHGDHTVFAALGGGVEAPAFNEIDPPPPYDVVTSFNPFLEAMHSVTYEVGTRGSLASRFGRWGYDVGIYQIDTENDIVAFNGGAFFYTAGKTRRRGVEAGLDWKPAKPVTIRSSGSFTKNEYVDYVNDVGDFGGNDMPGLPSAAFFTSARVDFPRGFGVTVSAEGLDRYFADDQNTLRTFAYGIVNASLDYAVRGDRLGFRAFVSGRNLLDKEHIASVFINPISDVANGPKRYIEPGLPQQFVAGASLTY
jgi:iron complex outermembrane receptor protein